MKNIPQPHKARQLLEDYLQVLKLVKSVIILRKNLKELKLKLNELKSVSESHNVNPYIAVTPLKYVFERLEGCQDWSSKETQIFIKDVILPASRRLQELGVEFGFTVTQMRFNKQTKK